MEQPDHPGLTAVLINSLYRRRRVLLAGLVLAGLALLSQAAWRVQQRQLRHDARYLLPPGAVRLTSQPDWVPIDIRPSAIERAGRQGPLCLLESGVLTARLAEAFRLEPWVKRVNRVEMRPPNRVEVDVVWRKPLAVALLPEGRMLPVDEDAVRLPVEGLNEAVLRRLPRITSLIAAPTEGEAWTDPRMLGAVALITRLGKDWERLCLADASCGQRPEIRGDLQYFQYELITLGGTRIMWGAGPSSPAPDEPPFEEKLARLKAFVAQNSFELDGYRSPQSIDLRYGLDAKRRIAKKNDDNRTARKLDVVEEDAELVK